MNIIIIPYRNRKKHLDYFLEHSYPKLKNVLGNLEILIIEQNKGKKFNRGKLLNVGFTYINNNNNNNNNNNYFFHDVDINPIHNKTLQKYAERVSNNDILGIYTGAHEKNRRSYTLGGVIKMKGVVFRKMNGFPNNYWGWGVEDKALQNRAECFKIKIRTFMKNNDNRRHTFFKIFNDINDRQYENMGQKFRYEYVLFRGLHPNLKKIAYIILD